MGWVEPCRYGENCSNAKRADCAFYHPREHIPCKYGEKCNNGSCSYKHVKPPFYMTISVGMDDVTANAALAQEIVNAAPNDAQICVFLTGAKNELLVPFKYTHEQVIKRLDTIKRYRDEDTEVCIRSLMSLLNTAQWAPKDAQMNTKRVMVYVGTGDYEFSENELFTLKTTIANNVYAPRALSFIWTVGCDTLEVELSGMPNTHVTVDPDEFRNLLEFFK